MFDDKSSSRYPSRPAIQERELPISPVKLTSRLVNAIPH
ncbi:hypothetical protein NJ7G_2857 [Natrinema sp. J7-2]|nr:hypothetical protein NJ7G_2857 [Natrinema sp. J7-2]